MENSYIKQNFTNGQILEEHHMNHIENGISLNAERISKLSEEMALKSDIPTDSHINELISTALAAIPNAEEASF